MYLNVDVKGGSERGREGRTGSLNPPKVTLVGGKVIRAQIPGVWRTGPFPPTMAPASDVQLPQEHVHSCLLLVGLGDGLLLLR